MGTGRNYQEARERLREVQGRKSRQIGTQNQSLIFMLVARKPLSFSELLQATGFSKPVLTKHLRTLEEMKFIYKDTAKPYEIPLEVGKRKIVYRDGEKAKPFESSGKTSKDKRAKIVYRLVEGEYENFFRQSIETSLASLDWYLGLGQNVKKKMKKETDRFVEKMVNIILEDAKKREKEVYRELGWKKGQE